MTKALVGLLVILETLATAASPARATVDFSVSRLAGTDRYDTARVIAEGTFPSAGTALIASGQTYPDALSASYLAGNQAAPILLTTATAPVPPATLKALSDLQVKNVILIGGPASIGPDVANQLGATPSTNPTGGTLNVTQLGGADRYATSALIAEFPGSTFVGTEDGLQTAIVASGTNFPDAVSAGPLADAARLPILLTDPSTLPSDTSSALTILGIQQVLILGGSVAVSQAVETSIRSLGMSTVRLAGTTRSDTSRLVAEFAISNLLFSRAHAELASGDAAGQGIDALAGGPHAGLDGPAPTLVTNSTTDLGAVATFAAVHRATLTSAHALGGPLRLPDPLLARLGAASGQGATNQTFPGSPSGMQSRPLSSALNPGQGAITVSFSHITAPVRIALFPCPDVSSDSLGNVLFKDTTPSTLHAADIGTTQTGAAAIVALNGTAQPAGTRKGGPLAPNSAGIVTVTVDSGAFDCAVPVAFVDNNPANGQLDLNALHQPVEAFGMAGPIGWVPSEAPNGSTGGIVQYVDRAQLLVVAGNQRYNLRSSDTPYYHDTFRITFQQFLTGLSVGDAFDFFAGQYTQVAPNTFDLYQDRPGTPSNVTAVAGDFDTNPADNAPNDVQIAWAAPVPLDGLIDHYVIRRYASDAVTVQATLSTAAGSGPYAETFNDLELAAGAYWYSVQAVSATGDTSTQSPLTEVVVPGP